MQQEEESKGSKTLRDDGPNKVQHSPANSDSRLSYDDDELIDMSDCSSDGGEFPHQ